MFGAKSAVFVCLLFAANFLLGATSLALGSQPVISYVKTGETGLASYEFIAFYNNSAEAIDVTDWCLIYGSAGNPSIGASSINWSNLKCLTPPSVDIRLMLQPFSYARFATSEFTASVSSFTPDGTFSAGLNGTSGHVRLLDADKNEIDKIGWGSALSPEAQTVPTHASGYVLQRKSITNTFSLKDTDTNVDDFESVMLSVIPASGIYEEVVVVDVCSNLDGMQASLPDDYLLDGSGLCQQDQCDNIDGLQVAVPVGYISSNGEDCEIQPVVLESSVLLITELLPNAASTDTGKEFIELYNPNNHTVDLVGYRLELGPAYSKTYTFLSRLLDPLSYVSFSDMLSGLTLPNSSATVRLIAPAGNVVSETEAYEDPKDDQAWAFINDVWQYTTQPTPALANLPTPEETEAKGSKTDELADCGQGKYRNPETNRCRKIETGDMELQPCEPGKERNPETNRCRNIVSSSSLVPCKAGQERNPETNRCRSIVSTASALKPCAPGQERNPETNRCRKVASLGASTLADVEDVPAASTSSTNWWILGSVIVAAGGYAAYEWRTELLRFITKLKP